MRSPGIIYRRYRQLKRRLFFEKLSESQRQKHKNCYYGVSSTIYDEDGRKKTIHLCAYQCFLEFREGKNDWDKMLRGVDLCGDPTNCNAYVNKYRNTKELVLKEFEKELSDPATKARLYPELCAYEWVLDKNLYDATQSHSIIARILVSLISFLENLLKATQGYKGV